MGPVPPLHLSVHHPVASYLALAAAPTGNAAELFAVVAVIYAVCLFTAGPAARPARGGPAMARRSGPPAAPDPQPEVRRGGGHAGLLLALAHGHTPPPAATASAPAAIAGCGGSNEALANCMAAAAPYGWTGCQTTCLDWLWTRESNFETGATNPTSGAYGIPQSLPAAKMAAAGADWQTNPATQIRWGLGYIAATYGTPVRRLEPRTGRGLVLTRARGPAIHGQARIVPASPQVRRRNLPETSHPEGRHQVTKAELITLLVMAVGLLAADPVHRPEVLARGRDLRGRLLPRHHCRRVAGHRPGDPFPRNVRALRPGTSTRRRRNRSS